MSWRICRQGVSRHCVLWPLCVVVFFSVCFFSSCSFFSAFRCVFVWCAFFPVHSVCGFVVIWFDRRFRTHIGHIGRQAGTVYPKRNRGCVWGGCWISIYVCVFSCCENISCMGMVLGDYGSVPIAWVMRPPVGWAPGHSRTSQLGPKRIYIYVSMWKSMAETERDVHTTGSGHTGPIGHWFFDPNLHTFAWGTIWWPDHIHTRVYRARARSRWYIV